MKVLDARTLGVDAVIRAVDRPPSAVAPDVLGAVERIIADVRARGDAALLEYTARFDGWFDRFQRRANHGSEVNSLRN